MSTENEDVVSPPESEFDVRLLLGKNIIKDPYFKNDVDNVNMIANGSPLIFNSEVKLVKGGRSVELTLASNLERISLSYHKEIDVGHKFYSKIYYLVMPSVVSGNILVNPNVGNLNVLGSAINLTLTSMTQIEKLKSMYLLQVKQQTSNVNITINRIGSPVTNSLYILGLIVVDLTDTFGEGNEPPLEWCQENITPETVNGEKIIFGGLSEYPADSILATIKKLCGIEVDDISFDTDIITHINTTLFFLKQLDVGPEDGFSISGYDETWSDFWGDKTPVQAIKDYIYLRVNLLFDPPTSGVLHEAKERMIKELEYRLNVECDTWSIFKKKDEDGGEEDESDGDEDVNWGD